MKFDVCHIRGIDNVIADYLSRYVDPAQLENFEEGKVSLSNLQDKKRIDIPTDKEKAQQHQMKFMQTYQTMLYYCNSNHRFRIKNGLQLPKLTQALPNTVCIDEKHNLNYELSELLTRRIMYLNNKLPESKRSDKKRKRKFRQLRNKQDKKRRKYKKPHLLDKADKAIKDYSSSEGYDSMDNQPKNRNHLRRSVLNTSPRDMLKRDEPIMAVSYTHLRAHET